MTRLETINKAVRIALEIASDPSHGYDQAQRWGPDYDCSSFLTEVWERAGVPVKTAGARTTGNMYPAFTKCGFRDVKAEVNLHTGAGLERGDVLLNVQHHTEMYVGNGENVKASINEKGGVTGGQTGDQTGREIYVGCYYLPSYGWDYVLRYMGDGAEGEPETESPEEPEPEPKAVKTCKPSLIELSFGDKGADVEAAQTLLALRGFPCGTYGKRGDGVDGEFGDATLDSVMRFQESRGLTQTGRVGRVTWRRLVRG